MTWVCIITILFMLAQAGPDTRATFNYAVTAVAVLPGFAGSSWLVAAARNWLTGPGVQGSPHQLAAIERELAA